MNEKAEREKNIISLPELDVPEPKGMGSTFFYKMLEMKDKIAQVDGITGTKETYDVYLKKCIRTAITMRSKGIISNDIISICTLNHLNSSVPYIAGLFLGAKSANLDPSISLTDTIYLMNQVKPKMIFAGPESVKLMEDAAQEIELKVQIVVFGETSKHMKFSEFLEQKSEEETFKPVEVKNVRDTSVILFSSGTTGMPKGICLSHYGLLGLVSINTFYVDRGDLALGFASMFWISSPVGIANCIIHEGARLIYPKFDANAIWNLIAKHKVNSVFLVPNQMLDMCKNGRPVGADTSSLKYIFYGGSPMSANQIAIVRQCLPETILVKGYGQTELSGCVLVFNHLDQEAIKLSLKKPDSSGLPIPGLFYKIVDPDTEKILGPNQEGELRIKSRFEMNGYHNIDSSTCWDSDAFLKTGDIAYYDKDHCFYIVDRIKEVFKFQSWQISPAKIESVLSTHPSIHSAVVIGMPHPADGDHPLGIVVLKEAAAKSITGKEIEKYVEARVDDRQKLRGGVKIVQTIPLTSTGKVNRRQLRDLVLRGEI